MPASTESGDRPQGLPSIADRLDSGTGGPGAAAGDYTPVTRNVSVSSQSHSASASHADRPSVSLPLLAGQPCLADPSSSLQRRRPRGASSSGSHRSGHGGGGSQGLPSPPSRAGSASKQGAFSLSLVAIPEDSSPARFEDRPISASHVILNVRDSLPDLPALPLTAGLTGARAWSGPGEPERPLVPRLCLTPVFEDRETPRFTPATKRVLALSAGLRCFCQCTPWVPCRRRGVKWLARLLS